MEEYYNKHYIRVNASGCIIDGWSDGPHNNRQPTQEDICINDKGGYQFRLYYYVGPVMQRSEENPALFDVEYNIPLYKWDGEVLQRTAEELEADREAARQAAERRQHK